MALTDKLTDIANAIRNKTGNSAKLSLTDMVTEIDGITNATEPYVEEEYDSSENLTGAVLHGHTAVRDYAFYCNTNLEMVSIPSRVTYIGYNAFFGCTSLALTSLPDSLEVLGGSAFDGCTNLAIASIPAGITSIENNAFNGCTSLTTLTFEGTPSVIGTAAFSNCNNLTEIRVPWSEGDVDNAPWGATNATIIYNCRPIYGVEWNYSQSSTKLTRLEDAASFSDPAPAESLDAVGSSPFDSIMPWRGMKKYNIIDGAVAYSEDDNNFNMKAHDTVVYIPPFYYKAEKDTENQKWRWYISSYKLDGFELHPGSGRYIGRYHTSASYKSVSGASPITSITRATARTNSHAKGDGWWQMDFATWCAIELLYLVEFANWDSQSALGTGAMGVANDLDTGTTDGALYHTIKCNRAPHQYRNIENPYSRLTTWCDGFVVVSNRTVYIGTDNSVFGDTIGSLTSAKVALPTRTRGVIRGYGYSSAFPWAFIPDTSAQNDFTNTYVPDTVDTGVESCVLKVGGSISIGSTWGFFYCGANNRSSYADLYIGSRLIYIP